MCARARGQEPLQKKGNQSSLSTAIDRDIDIDRIDFGKFDAASSLMRTVYHAISLDSPRDGRSTQKRWSRLPLGTRRATLISQDLTQTPGWVGWGRALVVSTG